MKNKPDKLLEIPLYRKSGDGDLQVHSEMQLTKSNKYFSIEDENC